jgi:DNA-binding NarL/FixJ family response regulator
MKIFEVKGIKGLLVAVELGLHGEAVSVHSVAELDPLGWSRTRRGHNSISSEEKEKIIKLRLEGKSAKTISDELGVSRAAIQRIVSSLKIDLITPVRSYGRRLNEIEVRKIRRLLDRNWRAQTIADQMNVSPETVRQIHETMRSEQNVRALP